MSSTSISQPRRASSPSGRATPTRAGPAAVVRSGASASSADVPGATPDSRPGSTSDVELAVVAVGTRSPRRSYRSRPSRSPPAVPSAPGAQRRLTLGEQFAATVGQPIPECVLARPVLQIREHRSGARCPRRAGTLTAACSAAGQIRAPARCGTAAAGRGATREPFRRTLVLPRLDSLSQVFFEGLPIHLVCVFGRHLAPQPRLCVGNPAGYIYAIGVFRSVAKHG